MNQNNNDSLFHDLKPYHLVNNSDNLNKFNRHSYTNFSPQPYIYHHGINYSSVPVPVPVPVCTNPRVNNRTIIRFNSTNTTDNIVGRTPIF